MWSALTMTLLLWAPGLAWGSWCCSLPRDDDASNAYTQLAAVLSTGLLVVLLYAWMLLELGCFHAASLSVGLIVTSALGAWIGWRFHRPALIETLRKTTAPMILFLCLVLLAFAYAPRSEWIAGGWDPGVYLNQGIYAAQNGGWQSAPTLVLADLAKEETNPFIRPIAGRDELFPGIPLDPDSGAVRLTFYPLTPSWIALLHLLGGVNATFLAMPLLALLLVFILPGALLRAGAHRSLAFGATLLTIWQPVTLYHARTPNSEMLETVLVSMLLLAIPRANERNRLWFLSILMLAGIINRPTFLLWMALLFPLLACTRRLTVSRGFLLSIPLWIGVAYYMTLGQAALDRIAHLFPFLAAGTIALVYLSCVCVPLRRLVTWRHFPVFLFVSAPVIVLLSIAAVHPQPLVEFQHNVDKLIPYVGYPIILFAGVGLLCRVLAIWRTGRIRRLDLWLLLCVCAAAVPLVYKFVAELYPWATKRYLSAMPFALALAAAWGIHLLAQSVQVRRPRLAPMVWLTALLLIGVPQARRASDAWLNIEYDGLSAALSEVAEMISTEDIVLADHFLWATPLALIHQRQILNGERLWAHDNPGQTETALTFLRNQQASGRRVLMLTSTDQGPDVFPAPLQTDILLHAFTPYTYSVIAHHRNGTAFPLRDHTTPFRLYVLFAPP